MEAVILAGGKGTRLKSVIADMPKPMAPIGREPFLVYVFRYLQSWGISHVILSVGYKHEVIEQYFGSCYKNIKLSYCVEEYPLGTGGAVKKSLSMANEDNVLIINGDTYFDADIAALFNCHKGNHADLTMAVKLIEKSDRYGSVIIDKGRITGFAEKEYREKALINTGIYVIRRNLFDELTLPEKFSIEDDFFSKYFEDLLFYAQLQDRYFIDIGIPDDYERAQKELKELYE